MTNGSVVTNDGKNILLYRAWTPNASLSATQYLAPSKFKVSTATTNPAATDTSLTTVLPIANGVVNHAGATQLTGIFGGADTSDDTIIFKEGAGLSDATAQDLNVNGTSDSKFWYTDSLPTAVTSTKYCGMWLYIADATTLALFKSSPSNMFQIQLGNDSSNYYYVVLPNTSFTTGWNWLDFGIVNTWSSTGSPTGTLSRFVLQLTTNNSTDVWTPGKVVFDLLRTWDVADTLDTFPLGYPSFNTTDKTVQVNCYIDINSANGYLIDGCGIFNTDNTPLMSDKAKFTAESKSSSDEIIVSFVNRVR